MNEPPPDDLLETAENADDERIAPGTREVYVALRRTGYRALDACAFRPPKPGPRAT